MLTYSHLACAVLDPVLLHALDVLVDPDLDRYYSIVLYSM